MRKIKYRDRITTGSTAPQADDENDFGLGDKVARQPGTRLINADGSFNVIRRGRSIFAPYKNLVEMGWPRFIIITVLGYTVCNLGFAVAFYVVGPENLSGVEPSMSWVEQFLQCFYFSVQTFTTVGYGAIAPNSITTNALASLLALFGWIALALATGLFFARFSRPTRLIVFSEKAIVAPLGGGNSLQFRIANKRDTSLINVHAQVVLTYLEEGGPQQLNRHFRPLSLEREFVPLFPLNWTVVHPIVEGSPMFTWTREDLQQRSAELLVMIEGYDQTFAQQIHINNSYTFEEIEWNVRFQPMYRERESMTELFLDRISHTNPIAEEE